MRDSSKLLSRKSPQYADWEKFLSTIHAEGHRLIHGSVIIAKQRIT